MPDEDKLLPDCRIQCDGSDLPEDLAREVVEVVVEDSVHIPSAAMIRFHVDPVDDHELHVVENGTLREGKAIRISMGYGSATTQVFEGEITATELDLNASGRSTFTVRCLHKVHRMHRGRHRRTFAEVKDSDLISQLASECGLAADVQSTSTVFKWVVQNNESNWEFMKQLAWRNGYRVECGEGNKLKFKNVLDHVPPEVTLRWSEDIYSFRPRTNAVQQVDKVVVRAWDQTKKLAIIGESKGKPNGVPKTEEGKTGDKVAATFGSAKSSVVTYPVNDQAAADQLAQSLFDHIASKYLQAEMHVQGNPHMAAGKAVKIEGVGKRYGGEYLLSGVTHTYSPAEGYNTQAFVDGKEASSFSGGGSSPLMGEHLTEAHGMVVIGIVTDNKDPEELGRVKVKYPTMDDALEGDWARLVSPMAGAGRGIYFIPEIDDEVLVAFENGDMRRPFVLGALWNQKDKPIESNSEVVKSHVTRRLIKTKLGHEIILDEEDDLGEIKIKTNGGHFLTLSDKDKWISATSKDGHYIKISDQDKKITVEDNAKNHMILDASANSFTFECAGDFIVKARGNFNVEAMQEVNIKGQTGMSLKTPMSMNLEGTTQLNAKGTAVSVNGDAKLDLQTAIGSLQASGILTIQGSLVKIN